MRMSETGRQRQLRLPVAIDRLSRQPKTLEQVLAEPERLAAPEELTEAERVALVRARWEEGGWDDILICGEVISLQRAIAELDGRTKIGRDLQRNAERAIEMVLEDVRNGNGPAVAQAPPAGQVRAFPVPVQRLLLLDANVAADQATEIIYKQRRSLLYPEAAKSKFGPKKQELIGPDDTRHKVSASLKDFGTGYVTASGHGRPSYLTGWYLSGNDGPLQEILTEGKLDEAEIRGKIFHIFGCHTGYKGNIGLGRNLVSKGAAAFFGYSDAVIIPIKEADAKIFCECDIEIDLALITGGTCEEAYRKAYTKYKERINTYRADGYVNQAGYLEGNRDLLVAPATDAAYGKPDAFLVPEVD